MTDDDLLAELPAWADSLAHQQTDLDDECAALLYAHLWELYDA